MPSNTISMFSQLQYLGCASEFADDIQGIIQVNPLFENFTSDEYAILCQHMACFGTLKNTTILQESTPGDFVVLILTGQVLVVKQFGAHNDVAVASVGPGSFLGEMSLVDGQPRFASCVATAPTDFAVLTREKLNAILLNHAPLGAKLLLLLLQLTTSRLRETTARLLPMVAAELV